MAQRGGIVLVGIAAGDLENALAQQGGQGMATAAFAPGQAGGEAVAEAEGDVDFGEPEQAAVAGEPAAVAGRRQRDARCSREGKPGWVRLGHRNTAGSAWWSAPQVSRRCFLMSRLPPALMHNPG